MYELKYWYERDIPKITKLLFYKPEWLSTRDYSQLQDIQCVVSTVHANVNILSNNITGGYHSVNLTGAKKVQDFIRTKVNSPEYIRCINYAILQSILYGHAAMVYDPSTYKTYTLDSCYTQFHRHPIYKTIVAMCQYDPVSGTNEVWTEYGKAMIAPKGYENYTGYTAYDKPTKNFNVLYAEKPLSTDIYGNSIVRECIKFSKSISYQLYAANLKSRNSAASNIMVCKGSDGLEGNTIEPMGSMLVVSTPENVDIKMLDIPADIQSSLSSLQAMQAIECAIVGVPGADTLRSHQTAAASKLQNANITSTLANICKQISIFETEFLSSMINSKFNLSMSNEEIIDKYKLTSEWIPALYDSPLDTETEKPTKIEKPKIEEEVIL